MRAALPVLLTVVVVTLSGSGLFGQHHMTSLYPINPSLANPAFIGYHQRSEIMLNFRQQWLGINEAPQVANFQFNTALTPLLALGVQIQKDKRGPLQTNEANLLVAYRVLLGASSSLNFGLSGGIAKDGLNSKASYNPTDPAISGLLTGKLSPTLKFGTYYQMGGFRLGVTFTEMLPQRPWSVTSDNRVDAKPYENFLLAVDYRLSPSGSPLAVHPFVQYYHDKLIPDYAEAGALIHYRDLVYLGGVYRQQYGPGMLLGLQNKNLRVGYSYEFAPNQVPSLGQGSHQIQISYRFGRLVANRKSRKEEIREEKGQPNSERNVPSKEEAPSVSDTTTTREQSKETAASPNELKPSPEASPTEPKPSPAAPAFYYRGDHLKELMVGFYVVVGSYKTEQNAIRQTNTLRKAGGVIGYGYNSESQFYYVYVHRSSDLKKARSANLEYRKNPLLKDAWVLEIKPRPVD